MSDQPMTPQSETPMNIYAEWLRERVKSINFAVYKGDFLSIANAIDTYQRDLAAERAKVEMLEQALQFYAAPGNWENDMAECHGAPVSVPWTAPVYGDNGDIARAALNEGKDSQ